MEATKELAENSRENILSTEDTTTQLKETIVSEVQLPSDSQDTAITKELETQESKPKTAMKSDMSAGVAQDMRNELDSESSKEIAKTVSEALHRSEEHPAAPKPGTLPQPPEEEEHDRNSQSASSISGAIETKAATKAEETAQQEAPMVPEKDTKSTKKKPKKKLVGFAKDPEDLKDHHKFLDARRKEKMQSNPFWKIPPELSYLEKQKEGPKPLPSHTKKRGLGSKNLDDMKDLPTRAVKEISVINKDTALNFFYHEIDIPVGPDRILVDVKYASLSSLDLEKLNKYKLNLSAVRIGLGYDYVGEIVAVGAKLQNHSEYQVGTMVFGVVHPSDKKGSLQTLLIVNSRDIIIPINLDQMDKMRRATVKLTFDAPETFLVDDEESEQPEDDASKLNDSPPALPPKQDPYVVLFELAKFCTFSTMYCRAKQALTLMDAIFQREGRANIIINGADTCLGYTIAQTLASSVYQDILQNLNVILVIQDANLDEFQRFADGLNCGGTKKFYVLTFDLKNEDIVLPTERVPANYKKPLLFAAELFQLMFQSIHDNESILSKNVDQVKIDLFIDIVGSKKMFQRNLDVHVLDETHLPYKERFASGINTLTLFGKAKEPLLAKIFKPKSAGSTVVSYCDFATPVPTYSVDKQISSSQGLFNPWGQKWSSGLANAFLAKYNYYTLFELEVEREWVKEGLQLVLANELKMQIAHLVDWRNNFRHYIDAMRDHDGLTVFKVESF